MKSKRIYFSTAKLSDRTYAEIDLLFEMKVPARKFSSTEVDPFALHPVVNLNDKETGL
jgi:SP family general alpha glucoside:H+ symporter-like MFS transporter